MLRETKLNISEKKIQEFFSWHIDVKRTMNLNLLLGFCALGSDMAAANDD